MFWELLLSGWYLNHFGARTVHVAWYFATTSRIHLGLASGWLRVCKWSPYEAAFLRRGFSPTPRVVLRRFKAISCTRTHGGCGGGTWRSPTLLEISTMEMSTKNSVISTDFNYLNQEFSGDFNWFQLFQPRIQWWFHQPRENHFAIFNSRSLFFDKKGRTLLPVAASVWLSDAWAMPFRIHLLEVLLMTWQKTTTSYWCF